MALLKITDRVTLVGADDPGLHYFDCLMPTPYGTTYNSYLVDGDEKSALIDPVEGSKIEQLFEHLDTLEVKHLEYIVCLHAEQDHSGGAPMLLQRYPKAVIVATQKVADFLESHLHLPKDKMKIMNAGDTLELGGVSLECIPVPFAHWPDNTMYWLADEYLLFSSDLYGSHYVPDVMEKPDEKIQVEQSRTYFAEIMMPFRTHVARYVEKTRELDPAMICSAHGPVWFLPDTILSEYERMCSDKTTRDVAIAYVSMHGSTKRMVKTLAKALVDVGIHVKLLDLGSDKHDFRVPAGDVLTESLFAGALILASPTVIGGAHPLMAAMAMLIGVINPPLRMIGLIGSFGWGSQMVKQMEGLLERHRAERLDSLLIKGLPTDEDEKAIEEYAKTLAERLKAIPDEEILD